MTVMAAAVIGTTAISAVGQYKSAKETRKGIQAGIDSQEKTTDKNLELQRELVAQQRSDFAPWRETGEAALIEMVKGVESGAFEMGQFDIKTDPSYDFRMSEGVQALDKSASASGRLLSGAQNKAVTKYGQNLASTEYATAYSRQLNEKNRKYNILSSLAAGGQASAAGQAQSTGQLANTTNSALTNLGYAQNNAGANAGAARAGGYTGVATALNQGAQNWLTYKGVG